MNREYLETARLLIQVAPLVFVDDQFGLKGGTAINLFLRDMPRLSVDLDVVFTDHTVGREEAIARINAAIRDAADRLRARQFAVYLPGTGSDGETKLIVRRGAAEIKVEINTVMRGTVHPTRRANLTRDVKSFEFSGAKATMYAPNFGVLTYRASYDAKCYGQDVWPIWGTAFYVKHGDAWMWSGGINVLAGADWATTPAG